MDLAYPGVLPVLNAEAVRMAVKFGLAIGASDRAALGVRAQELFLSRSAEGLSDQPVRAAGREPRDRSTIVLEDGTQKTVGVTRAHLEEDAGKSLHEGLANASGIDLNRAGTPLLEIVSEPDMRSAKEAVAYMKKIHTLVRYLEICDGNMQEGSFRCDANVSVRPRGQEKFGTRAEIKNLNSFRFVEKAIQYEVARQIELIESGGKVVQETRLYDSDKDETRSMRSKEEANDYRYFPDPGSAAGGDRGGLHRRGARAACRSCRTRRRRGSRTTSACRPTTRACCRRAASSASISRPCWPSSAPRTPSSRPTGSWASCRARSTATTSKSPARKVLPAGLKGLLARIVDATISGKIAKDVFEAMWSEGKSADADHRGKGLKQITDSGAIESVIDAVIAANPKQLADYRAGKDKLFGFFVGQVMKAMGGKANPAQLNDLLKAKLGG